MSKQIERAWLVWLSVFTFLATCIRIWLAGSLDLAPDETYYWQWSNDLSLTYLDHPPLIAWLIRAGTLTVGQNPIGVRLHCILFAAAAIAIVYRLARRADLTRTHAMLTASLSSMLPAPASASIIATPDTALGVCWLLALSALIRLAGNRTDGSMGSWYLLGAALGFGLLAKHTALLILFMVCIVAIRSAKIRHDLCGPHPWLAAALAVLIALPYLIAQAKTGFKGFSFQLAHLFGAINTEPTGKGPQVIVMRITELVGGQLGLVTPLVALWVVIAFAKIRNNPCFSILTVGFVLPAAATCISALFTHPEQNWASLGHPVAAIIALIGIIKCLPMGRPMAQVWIAVVLTSVLIITAIIHTHAVRPFLPLPPDRDPTSRLHGWDNMKPVLKYAADCDAVVCDNYGLAAETAWQLKDVIQKPAIGSTDRPFDPPMGRWLFLDQQNDWGQAKAELGCPKVRSLKSLILKRGDGAPLRTIAVSIGENCRP
jgi:4-amino-4-deoxy-L-arabinose transferase-like glycosyltransferase